MNITSKTHKLHGYHYQSLDKKKESLAKHINPPKILEIFTLNNRDE